MPQSIDQQHKAISNQNFIAIDEMPEFNEFVRKKNTFLFSITSAFLFIYILLPILAFRPILQTPILGAITGVWFYSAGLFLMTIILCTLYIRKAAQFDKQASAILTKYQHTEQEAS